VEKETTTYCAWCNRSFQVLSSWKQGAMLQYALTCPYCREGTQVQMARDSAPTVKPLWP